jgi:hypothetical protein
MKDAVIEFHIISNDQMLKEKGLVLNAKTKAIS